MSESTLRDVNRIPPKMLVKAGSVLLVPRSATRQADVPVHVADGATLALAPDSPPLRKTTLKAGRKDSVASIAQRYRVGVAQVAQWNDVAESARFKPGQTIVVYQPAKRVRVAAKAPPKAASGTKSASAGAAKPVRVAAKPAGKRSKSAGHDAGGTLRVAATGAAGESPAQ